MRTHHWVIYVLVTLVLGSLAAALFLAVVLPFGGSPANGATVAPPSTLATTTDTPTEPVTLDSDDTTPTEPADTTPLADAVTQQPGSPALQEDDPGWDCRTMGNHMCGIQVEGIWYVLDFTTNTFTER